MDNFGKQHFHNLLYTAVLKYSQNYAHMRGKNESPIKI